MIEIIKGWYLNFHQQNLDSLEEDDIDFSYGNPWLGIPNITEDIFIDSNKGIQL